jgi:hypothetical protein
MPVNCNIFRSGLTNTENGSPLLEESASGLHSELYHTKIMCCLPSNEVRMTEYYAVEDSLPRNVKTRGMQAMELF